jgi:hypothetical protein
LCTADETLDADDDEEDEDDDLDRDPLEREEWELYDLERRLRDRDGAFFLDLREEGD